MSTEENKMYTGVNKMSSQEVKMSGYEYKIILLYGSKFKYQLS